MPRHVWTVLCSNTSVDKATNNVTLFEAVEGLSLPPEVPADRDVAIQLELVLVTLWSRTNPAVPEAGNGRFRLVAPEDQTLMTGEHDLSLGGQYIRSRNFSRLRNLPLHGPGFYEFVIEYRVAGEQEWVEATRVPLEVRFQAAAPQATEA